MALKTYKANPGRNGITRAYVHAVMERHAAMADQAESERHGDTARAAVLDQQVRRLGSYTSEAKRHMSDVELLEADKVLALVYHDGYNVTWNASTAFTGFSGGRPMGKKQPLPNAHIVFSIDLEEENVEEDLNDSDEPERRAYAQAWTKKFAEGAGWARMQNEELAKLEKMLGFKVYNVDSENGELRGIDTVADVLKVYNAVRKNYGGGDDIIYFDQYIAIGNFLLFPDGFNGPRYRFDHWDEFFAEHGIEV